MTESVKKTQGDTRDRETPKEKNVEEPATYQCIFENEETFVKNDGDLTLFVRGFDPCLPKDDISTALFKHFVTRGVVTRVFVPTECKTGATIGYAFVDMQSDVDHALKLHGSSLGGSSSLEVTMARDRKVSGLANLRGCPRCAVILR